MIEVSTTSSKTGVAYDNRGYHPAASAYDRGHELAQALCAGAAHGDSYVERPANYPTQAKGKGEVQMQVEFYNQLPDL